MKKLINKYYIQIVLALLAIIESILLIPCVSYIVPIMLNYKYETLNNDFQLSIEKITYSNRVLLIGFLMLITYLIILFIKTKKLTNLKNKIITKSKFSEKEKITYKTILHKLPFSLYKDFLIISIAYMLLLPTIFLNSTFNIPFVKEFFINFSVVILASSVFVLLNRLFLSQILNKIPFSYTYKPPKSKIVSDVIIILLPIFIVGLLNTAFIGYSQSAQEKGVLSYDSYQIQLDFIFDESNPLRSKADLNNRLNSISSIKDTDIPFLYLNNKYYSKDFREIKFSNFFTKYLNELSGKTHVYDSYGSNSEAAIKEIIVENESYIIGVYYNNDSLIFTKVFILSLSIMFILGFIVLLIFSKILKFDIQRVTIGMKNIGNKETLLLEKPLPLTSSNEIGGLTIAFNNVLKYSQKNISIIKDNQELLLEKERLASLGQLIAGISHNLNTPIMSIAGTYQALLNLIEEYTVSIGDPQVSAQDNKEIAKEMNEWIVKGKKYLEYMSDVISTVKGQAVSLTNTSNNTFTINEVLKSVNILMQHELNKSLVTMKLEIDDSLLNYTINGNLNSLVQVINNIISNAIQSYNNKTNEKIILKIYIDKKDIVFEIKDFGIGMSQSVKSKLFKEMITTKGNKGTGLGLFMSYSNIKAHFNGDIKFISKEGKGTTFFISIPYN